MFGDASTNPYGWSTDLLGSLADVQGGLQVTGARSNSPIECPYLRVANVHRDRLDLSEIKRIRAAPAEVERTRLTEGDLLIVEGHGNPGEVGRVATWDGSVDPCTHQNHLIRARTDRRRLLPGYACALLNSTGGRQFLLRAGKTTSGLSTISTRNVKEVTLMVPPLNLQRAFEDRAREVRSIEHRQAAATALAVGMFEALLGRVFGEAAASA